MTNVRVSHFLSTMANRVTLVSDATNEFPNNKNNSYRMRIPNGLQLRGDGWHVALLSLTLPNRTSHQFASGHEKSIVRTHYTSFAFKHPNSDSKYTAVDLLQFDNYVYEADIAMARDGVGFWKNVIRTMNHDMDATIVNYREKNNVHVFTKKTMFPTFTWDGEDLVINKRGRDISSEVVRLPALYSTFDIALEVAAQWGLVQQDDNGKWVAGPNLQIVPFDGSDKITADDPPRTSSVTPPGNIKSFLGPTYRFEFRYDMPFVHGDITAVQAGSTRYQLIWKFTEGSYQWIRLSGMVEWRLINLQQTYNDIHKHPNQSVMVYTNLQRSTIVGEKTVQLLREIVVSGSNEEGHSYAEPKHLQWIPVASNHMDIAEVQLADVNGALLSLPPGKSLVTVAFQQKV